MKHETLAYNARSFYRLSGVPMRNHRDKGSKEVQHDGQ
jgi:hypothetical protein